MAIIMHLALLKVRCGTFSLLCHAIIGVILVAKVKRCDRVEALSEMRLDGARFRPCSRDRAAQTVGMGAGMRGIWGVAMSARPEGVQYLEPGG